MGAGDVCLFGGFVLHRSGTNRSQQPRHLLYTVYKQRWWDDDDEIDMELINPQ